MWGEEKWEEARRQRTEVRRRKSDDGSQTSGVSVFAEATASQGCQGSEVGFITIYYEKWAEKFGRKIRN
jgi:hypothetical protein